MIWLPGIRLWVTTVAELSAPGVGSTSRGAPAQLVARRGRWLSGGLAGGWRIWPPAPFTYDDATTYTGGPAPLPISPVPDGVRLSDIIGRLLEAGPQLDFSMGTKDSLARFAQFVVNL